jgi:hypothetical protein
MPYYRAFLSALTLFGGHFLNRRLDRVVLVFGALAFVGVTTYVILPNLLLRDEPIELEDVQWLWRIPTIMVMVIAGASACVTWLDARAAPGQPLSLSTLLAGGMVSTFGLIVVGTATLTTLAKTTLPTDGHAAVARNSKRTTAESSPFTVTRQFHSTVLFGGNMQSYELPPPPQGDNFLRGRIVLEGQPASGITLQVYLNESFKSEQVTDARGEFQLGLPAGEWHVNVVTASDWPEQPPDRDLVLFSEHEPRLGEGFYSRYDWSNKKGLRVQLPAAPDSVAVALELRDPIQIEWPAATPRFFSDDEQPAPTPATIDRSAIRWRPVAAATQYQIQINRVTREDKVTHYASMLVRRQSEPSLALSTLPRQEENSDIPGEYAVAVFAFDAQGKLVSQSEVGMDAHLFQIAGKVRLAEEKSPCKAAAESAAKSASNVAAIAKISSASNASKELRNPRCS